ncbi:hypothetical protein AKJ64_00570 [candidate division MSBL1 archaeon SCGC-AAA259E17]|uniref:Uncharacterized protein n=1 Tax=candidate division MSBL1 archaeon SCGC-AAA259E17 TaxID=1698263 RepID=A0A133UGT3_9EURY|nr:hypothetical protein AKJ64_00570 [candidate division MSBL1 archaeon SCGC-AAA259E17]
MGESRPTTHPSRRMVKMETGEIEKQKVATAVGYGEEGRREEIKNQGIDHLGKHDPRILKKIARERILYKGTRC